MNKVESKYFDLLNQQARCNGTITNKPSGIIIEIKTKDYITKEDFFINYLNKFRSGYELFADRYNQKEFKKMLKNKIEEKEAEIEQLKFAHKVCGRKIL